MDNGGGDTGWSRIWASALYARSLKGDLAANSAMVLLTNHTYSNLLSFTSGTYQIDANLGAVAAINEMFLQSHSDGIVHIGPALPTSKLADGSYKNWKARGGYTVSAEWNDGHISRATIGATVDGPLKVRIEDGRAFQVDGREYTGPIQVQASAIYTITF